MFIKSTTVIFQLKKEKKHSGATPFCQLAISQEAALA
jgi:hypothetical protein